jgi:hypothetical protein
VALNQVRRPYFDRWLSQLPAVVAAEIAALLDYLSEHGRGATLPYVRHRIQISRHFPDMSELRTDHTVEGIRYVMRVLTCFIDGDQGVLVCVGGTRMAGRSAPDTTGTTTTCQRQIRSLTVISPEEEHHECQGHHRADTRGLAVGR